MANLWWQVDRRRQRVAVHNILRSKVTEDPRTARTIGRRSAQHFAQVIIESLKSADVFESDGTEDRCRAVVAPDVLKVLETPEQGMIMASGHFGNWEIAAHKISTWKPVAGITRAMNNPRVEELVQSRKARYNFRPIPKYAADPKRFLNVLNSGEVLALLCDQHAHKGSMMVPFFGHPAATHTTAAMLHLVTRKPLCFAACRRVGPMHFELTTSELIEQPSTGNKKADVRAILDRINHHLEQAIRADPEQYLWSHRRWRD